MVFPDLCTIDGLSTLCRCMSVVYKPLMLVVDEEDEEEEEDEVEEKVINDLESRPNRSGLDGWIGPSKGSANSRATAAPPSIALHCNVTSHETKGARDMGH